MSRKEWWITLVYQTMRRNLRILEIVELRWRYLNRYLEYKKILYDKEIPVAYRAAPAGNAAILVRCISFMVQTMEGWQLRDHPWITKTLGTELTFLTLFYAGREKINLERGRARQTRAFCLLRKMEQTKWTQYATEIEFRRPHWYRYIIRQIFCRDNFDLQNEFDAFLEIFWHNEWSERSLTLYVCMSRLLNAPKLWYYKVLSREKYDFHFDVWLGTRKFP